MPFLKWKLPQYKDPFKGTPSILKPPNSQKPSRPRQPAVKSGVVPRELRVPEGLGTMTSDSNLGFRVLRSVYAGRRQEMAATLNARLQTTEALSLILNQKLSSSLSFLSYHAQLGVLINTLLTITIVRKCSQH